MFLATLKIFVWKHYKYYIRVKLKSTLLNIGLVIGMSCWIMYRIKDTLSKKGIQVTFTHFAIIASVGYMLSVIDIVVTPMVEEKALGIREFLRMATTHSRLNLITFYLLHVLLGTLVFVVIMVVAQIWGILQEYSVVCALFHILLFMASAIAYAFLTTVMFNETLNARICTIPLFLLPMALPRIGMVKWLAPLFSINLFHDGWTLLEHNVDTIFENHSSTMMPYSLFGMWCIIAANLVAYVLLYTYVGQVFPGAYGTPLPFYFPALGLMQWFCGNAATERARIDAERAVMDGSSRCGEPVVRVRSLIKDFGHLFGEKNRAVNNVDMDICANQITVLLGHNGAGKTTTMSMISGVIPKTTGEISVNGERDVNKYRKVIGYCPQHNVFLPYFTCMDHLIFFGVLRGLSHAEAKEKSRALLDRLKLLPKANEYGKNLSGGMKRRLGLGIALIGDTKIAILDEPSSGLDPESRRELWNILIEMRKQHTIVITTHYMEEAETLADYISIMSRGKILCHGTAQQLKRRYADGYVLKLLTNEHFDMGQTMEIILKHIPGAKVKSYVQPTLNVTLPYNDLDKYSETLAELESALAQLCIVSIGLSNASLEDVFLNSDLQKRSPDVPDLHGTSKPQTNGNYYSVRDIICPAMNIETLSEDIPIRCCDLWIEQVIAIIYNKSVYARRHCIRLLICVLILALAVFIGIRVLSHNPNEISGFAIYKLVMPIALYIYMLYYASMPFAENNTQFKQLQIIPSSVYWTIYYAFDAAQHMLICMLLFCLHVAVDLEQSLTPYEHGQLVCLYTAYGLVNLPIIYVLAHLFDSIDSVYSFLSFVYIGSTSACLYFFAENQKDIQQYAVWMSILYVLPDYALQHSIYVLVYGYLNDPIDDPINGWGQYYKIVLIGVMLALLIFVLEHIYRRQAVARVLRLYRPILRALRKKKAVVVPPIVDTMPTQEVNQERDRTDAVVQSHSEANYAIVVSKLHKMYDGVSAVRGVNFIVPRGECFGLLGMNGAGKTTTFKMMARQLTISEGAIYFNGLNSRAQEFRYRHQFGYCPQTDALNSWMTAHETLKYMGLARGISWGKVNDVVSRLMRKTDLTAYADVTVKKMSGGTKRKLNTAMAIQNYPLLVFLDEPTTGVDPSSRRFMWACIQECQRQNKNIVLTSHSMDECEFLCNRLAIMDRGQLNCIGPIQLLKRSFALGIIVTVHLRDGQAGTSGAAQMRQTVLDRLQCVLREEYGNQLTFVVQNINILWSELFNGVMAVQQQFESVVEDISLSESSLEDIFVKIASQSKND